MPLQYPIGHRIRRLGYRSFCWGDESPPAAAPAHALENLVAPTRERPILALSGLASPANPNDAAQHRATERSVRGAAHVLRRREGWRVPWRRNFNRVWGDATALDRPTKSPLIRHRFRWRSWSSQRPHDLRLRCASPYPPAVSCDVRFADLGGATSTGSTADTAMMHAIT
jgi:hypothetical protein